MGDPNSAEWQAPPPPEKIEQPEGAEMSEVSTLFSIFFEPGRVFDDLKRKPRFILATVITALLISGYSFGLHYKIGDAGLRQFIAEQIDKSPRAGGMSSEDKTRAIDMQMTISSVVSYALPVIIFVIMLIGGLLYWVASKIFGGVGRFTHNLAVWVYSGLPPTVVSMVASYIVLMFKSVDDIDIAASQRGMINANPAFLIDGKSMPVLATLVGTIDLFFIWGWILAAIGLRITNKISSGSAWAVVIIFALIQVAFRVVGAYFSGNPG